MTTEQQLVELCRLASLKAMSRGYVVKLDYLGHAIVALPGDTPERVRDRFQTALEAQ